MSVLANGVELIESPVQARSVLNADLQRLADMGRIWVPFCMWGKAQAGTDKIIAKGQFDEFDAYLEAVQFEAFAGAPAGADLILRVKINGTLHAQAFTLAAGSSYSQAAAATTTTVLIPAGQAWELYFSQVGSTAPGYNVGGRLKLMPRKL
jgi:hypothetical protein